MKPFKFKEFVVKQDKVAMKVGTDAVLLGAWVNTEKYPDSILDVGAGSGIIALMLAQRTDAMTIDAVELDEDAYEQAVDNFEGSHWGDRLFCYNAAFEDFVVEMEQDEEFYDLIVSNPPFYTDEYETKSLARNKARFTSSLSFKDLISGVVRILDKQGSFNVIIPFKEQSGFVSIANEKGLYLKRICKVKGNEDSEFKRVLLEFTFESFDVEQTTLVIEKQRHCYTDDYINLTKEFYLKM